MIEQLEQEFPVQLGRYTVYGNVFDFAVLGGAGLFGITLELMADVKFNNCLMDTTSLLLIGYKTYYFWDTWWTTLDESEIVKAIIYAI